MRYLTRNNDQHRNLCLNLQMLNHTISLLDNLSNHSMMLFQCLHYNNQLGFLYRLHCYQQDTYTLQYMSSCTKC